MRSGNAPEGFWAETGVVSRLLALPLLPGRRAARVARSSRATFRIRCGRGRSFGIRHTVSLSFIRTFRSRRASGMILAGAAIAHTIAQWWTGAAATSSTAAAQAGCSE
jgi:hypothetical protein